MVGKKKQNYTYEQMVEGILDKFIAIEPKIMVYKQKIMTEMLREKYIDPNIPIKKTKRYYKMVEINEQPYFIDEFNNLWTEHRELSGIAEFDNKANKYVYYFFAELEKKNEEIKKFIESCPK